MRRIQLAFAALLTLIMAAGCNLSSGEQATADRQVIFTQAAQTLEARLTEVALGALPTVTPLISISGTEIPVLTPDSGNPTPADFTPEPGTPCDRGEFVDDISIPDGTKFNPGDTFVKTWEIRNNGACTWTSGYNVVFDGGNAMGGQPSFALPNDVPPGNTIQISVDLIAPQVPGGYRGDWKLRNAAGQTFGLGDSADSPFWVIITVGAAPEFTLSYDHIHTCSGTSHAIFRIQNSGDSAFESVEITLTNQGTGSVIFGPESSNGPFMGAPNECPPGGDTSNPGTTRYIGASLGPNAASGQQIRADIEICSSDNLQGECAEESVTFNIP